ncbi:MAG: PKD domain-containing protein [Bacteroidota bacterium]
MLKYILPVRYKILLLLFLSLIPLTSFGQLIDVYLEGKAVCGSNEVSVDIWLNESSLSSSTLNLSTSSMLLNYDAALYEFVDYIPAEFDGSTSAEAHAAGWEDQVISAPTGVGIINLVLLRKQFHSNDYRLDKAKPKKVGSLTFTRLSNALIRKDFVKINFTYTHFYGTDNELINSNITYIDICNDGNSCTINDGLDENCNCRGEEKGLVDFNSYPVSSHGGTQDAGIYEVQEEGKAMKIANNAWKSVPFTYTITPNTVLEFEFKSDMLGEYHLIGMSSNGNWEVGRAFKLYGTQAVPGDIDDFNTYSGSEYVSYQIPIGQYYTGYVNRIFFAADHDDPPSNATSYFRNVKVSEAEGCLLDTISPSVPLNLVASNISKTSLDLDWTASTDNEKVAGYFVYQGANNIAIATTDTNFINLSDLNPGSTYVFKVAAFDEVGNISAQSQALQVNLPSNCKRVDFAALTISPHGVFQDKGQFEVQESGSAMKIANNAWKSIPYEYTISPNTILEFEFKSDVLGEYHLIGMSKSNTWQVGRAFKLYGTQFVGGDIDDFNTYSGSEYVSFSIPIGQYYLGEVDRIFFAADHDEAPGNATSYFRNVRVYEEGECRSIDEALCFTEFNGEIVMEAENFHTSEPGLGNAANSSWTVIQDPSTSGGLALEAGPNTGVWTGLNTNGPRLDYHLNFSETGIYTVYIRTSAPGNNDDSYHIGLNGSAITNNSGYGMGLNGSWAWADRANQGELVQINVPSVGKHVFNIWMREDGVKIDKIVISKNGAPTAQGPGESQETSCGEEANRAPLVSFTASPSSGIAPVNVAVDASASTDEDGSIISYEWDFGDGQIGQGISSNHSYTSPGSYTLSLKLTDDEGLTSQSSKIITVSPNGTGPLCHTENNGQVVIEAENYTQIVSGSGNAAASNWEVFQDASSMSNGEGIRAVPNTGVYTGLATNGVRADYDISFSTAGTYRIYVRSKGSSNEDDSYHVGLNGLSVSSTSGYGMGFSGPWVWADFANDDDFVEVIVPTTGLHTFNLWMREDGVEVDKIVLKIIPGVPSGMGPAESLMSECSAQNLSLQNFSVQETGGNAKISWGNFFEKFQDNYVLERSIDGVVYEVLEGEEIEVDRMFNEHTDPNLRKHEVNQLFYRLKIKDAAGRIRKQKAAVLNLKKDFESFSFEAYPIPVKDQLSLSFNNSSGKELDLTVINNLGQLIYSDKIGGLKVDGLLRIQTDKWGKGIYFIQLTNGEQKQVRRLLKE